MRGESSHHDWAAGLRAAADSAINDSYRRFVAKVAAGRGLSLDAAEAVAQGRVWLGDDAKANHLVDEIGGLGQGGGGGRPRRGISPGEPGSIAAVPRPRAPPVPPGSRAA